MHICAALVPPVKRVALSTCFWLMRRVVLQRWWCICPDPLGQPQDDTVSPGRRARGGRLPLPHGQRAVHHRGSHLRELRCQRSGEAGAPSDPGSRPRMFGARTKGVASAHTVGAKHLAIMYFALGNHCMRSWSYVAIHMTTHVGAKTRRMEYSAARY